MIIVRIIGGLGNQMFQYAFYRSLKEKRENVKMDISGFAGYGLHNGYELPAVFNIYEDIASDQEVRVLSDSSSDFFSRARRKLLGRKKTHFIQEDFRYIPEVFNLDNVLLDGYWQSEKYFMDSAETIRNDFEFKSPLDEVNLKVAEQMSQSNSVSLHVRRGDYVSDPQAAKVHGGITTLAYYQKAIEIIKQRVDNPVFFVFSDDMEWVKNHMDIAEGYFIDWNKGNNSYKDMQLMSLCQHNIIANSSFSWWGAWLNRHPQKTVIAPSKWFNTRDTEDVIPDSWIKININNL